MALNNAREYFDSQGNIDFVQLKEDFYQSLPDYSLIKSLEEALKKGIARADSTPEQLLVLTEDITTAFNKLMETLVRRTEELSDSFVRLIGEMKTVRNLEAERATLAEDRARLDREIAELNACLDEVQQEVREQTQVNEQITKGLNHAVGNTHVHGVEQGIVGSTQKGDVPSQTTDTTTAASPLQEVFTLDEDAFLAGQIHLHEERDPSIEEIVRAADMTPVAHARDSIPEEVLVDGDKGSLEEKGIVDTTTLLGDVPVSAPEKGLVDDGGKVSVEEEETMEGASETASAPTYAKEGEQNTSSTQSTSLVHAIPTLHRSLPEEDEIIDAEFEEIFIERPSFFARATHAFWNGVSSGISKIEGWFKKRKKVATSLLVTGAVATGFVAGKTFASSSTQDHARTPLVQKVKVPCTSAQGQQKDTITNLNSLAQRMGVSPEWVLGDAVTPEQKASRAKTFTLMGQTLDGLRISPEQQKLLFLRTLKDDATFPDAMRPIFSFRIERGEGISQAALRHLKHLGLLDLHAGGAKSAPWHVLQLENFLRDTRTGKYPMNSVVSDRVQPGDVFYFTPGGKISRAPAF